MKSKEEIKQVLNKVQDHLDSLQGDGTSFLFVANDGNRFVMSGHTHLIAAQIVFAMMRYPVVRDIIRDCANHFDILNARHGDDVRNIKMDHLIEEISEIEK